MCEYKNDPYDLTSLLNYLPAQLAPYFNYVLCVYDENSWPFPVYVGYTNDLPNRMYTHARLVEFDEVFIYHSPNKEIALANEQALMDLLGTRALFNGILTQMGHVSHDELIAASLAQGGPPDTLWRYVTAHGYIRKTYSLTPTLLVALRYRCYAEELDLSEAVRLALAKGIQSEYLEAAYQKVGQGKEGKKVLA